MRDDKIEESIKVYKKPDLFFKEALEKASKNQHLVISEEAQAYVLGILISVVKHRPEDKQRKEGMLTEKYMVALVGEHHDLFRAVGDSSLVVAGIWWQSLIRKIVDVNHYIEIGSRSYQGASHTGPEILYDLFDELADNFKKIVNVLAEVTACVYGSKLSNSDVLKMYEVWLQTHNTFLADKLKELGINVVPGTVMKQ